MGVQSVGCASVLGRGAWWLGLGWITVVWLLRWIFCALSGVSVGGSLAYQYLIAANLQAAYADRAENADAAASYDQGPSNYGDGGGQAANSGPVMLTPEVKQAIAEEVKAQ